MSNLRVFRLYFIEKDIIRGASGGKFERIDWQLTNIKQPPLISELIYFFMKPMLSIFQLAIKFDYQFLAIFQSFFSRMSLIFDKLAPSPNKRFKICFKLFLSLFQCKRQSQKY